MNVTHIKLSYRRSRQPASYESAEPAVEFSASLEEGEDHVLAAHALMADAVNVVHAQIGLKPVETPDRGKLLKSAALAAEVEREPAKEEDNLAPVRGHNAEKLMKKLLTAPKGADFEEQRARLPKAKQAELDELMAASDLPNAGPNVTDEPAAEEDTPPDAEGLDRAIRGITNSPEDRQPPAEEVPDTAMLEALQKAAGKHGGAKVNGIVREFGVMQARQLTQEQRVQLLDKLKEL